MLKKTITFEDFNGKQQTRDYWFHLSKPDLVEIDAEYPDGLEGSIRKFMDEDDRLGMLRLFKNLILRGYGVKSEDGLRFERSPEIARQFEQSPAYESLFVELGTQPDMAADFIRGIVPRDLAQELKAMESSMPPAAPSSTLPPPTL